ncbi:MAG TPA: hypothetical protein ENN67_03615 [Firmicutes bacterium]|nr:hypothetical protein [Bacillota bacterium]
MFFPRYIRRLADMPGPTGLALLWWSEVTVLLCALAAGYFFSSIVFEKLPPRYDSWLFAIALVTYLLVFYIIHFEFVKISQLMEALMHIHRMGGLARIERLRREEAIKKKGKGSDDENGTGKELYDPLKPPRRIRASGQVFKIRYFIVLPSAILLYLFCFTGNIYRIFTRQVLSWDPADLVFPALTAALVACVCFWLLMPHLPGYVSLRKLLGNVPEEGD